MPGVIEQGDTEGEPQHYILERTGSPPIEFDGWVIARGSTLTEKKDDRGYEITVYKSTAPKGRTWRFVIHIRYLTKWKVEADGSTVYGADTGAEAAIKLLSYDPMYFVVGYPPGERFYEKRQRLESTLRNQYLSLASKLLTSVPGAAQSTE